MKKPYKDWEAGYFKRGNKLYFRVLKDTPEAGEIIQELDSGFLIAPHSGQQPTFVASWDVGEEL